MTALPSSQIEVVAAIHRVQARCDAAGVPRPEYFLGKDNAAWWRKHAADALKAGLANGSVHLLTATDFIDEPKPAKPALPDLFGAAA